MSIINQGVILVYLFWGMHCVSKAGEPKQRAVLRLPIYEEKLGVFVPRTIREFSI